MASIFVDTGYWVAVLNPRDNLNQIAIDLGERIRGRQLVTSELVLAEVLDHFANLGVDARELALQYVRHIIDDPNIVVVAQTSGLFRKAIDRYGSRLDKSWGIVDCSSFVLMEDMQICDALAYDGHFAQAGFNALMREG